MKKQFIVLFAVFTITALPALAQQETSFGVQLLYENAGGGESSLVGGLILDHKITRRSGFEIGLVNRSKKVFGSVDFNFSDGQTLNQSFTIREYYLNLPILYKFNTQIVNLSIGPTLDLYMGWKQIGGSEGLEVTSYSQNPKTYIGIMGKISKSIRLSEGLLLEPELRFNYLNLGEKYIGLGVALKYKADAFKAKFGKNPQ